jgi:hypothetical protein
MPRLSIDIDLTYLPVQPRAESLAAITAAMKRIKGRLEKTILGVQVTGGTVEGATNKLFIRAEGVFYLLSHDRPISEVLSPTRKDFGGFLSQL